MKRNLSRELTALFKSRITALTILTLLVCGKSLAQEDVQIGSTKYYSRMMGGYFDYSDPTGINIKVQVWGYVKYPGYYIIPARSTVSELLSLAGGPNEQALMNDIRILRTNIDSSVVLLKFDYDDLLWGENLNSTVKFPRIMAGDILIVPGEPRYFVREDITFILSITFTIASLASLIISIIK